MAPWKYRLDNLFHAGAVHGANKRITSDARFPGTHLDCLGCNTGMVQLGRKSSVFGVNAGPAKEWTVALHLQAY